MDSCLRGNGVDSLYSGFSGSFAKVAGNGFLVGNEVNVKQRKPPDMFGNHGIGRFFKEAAHEENPLNRAYGEFRGILGDF